MTEVVEIAFISALAALGGSLVGAAGSLGNTWLSRRNALRRQRDRLEHDAQSAQQERIRGDLIQAYNVLSGIKDVSMIELQSIDNTKLDLSDCPFIGGNLDKLLELYISQRENMRIMLRNIRVHCIEAWPNIEEIYKLLPEQYTHLKHMI